ncbi:hypothetical protein AV530_004665 [Patagioenas fasciata monilis]|uniref:Uncharacterized protein n=1 Tax=Patagioenas fasciata monilis TaxID=372326 RepID=A0A1V4KJJ0_PATFA|nr:hypothetical protein AV530_004665 [Patagioenas fasciata monilis]
MRDCEKRDGSESHWNRWKYACWLQWVPDESIQVHGSWSCLHDVCSPLLSAECLSAEDETVCVWKKQKPISTRDVFAQPQSYWEQHRRRKSEKPPAREGRGRGGKGSLFVSPRRADGSLSHTAQSAAV